MKVNVATRLPTSQLRPNRPDYRPFTLAGHMQPQMTFAADEDTPTCLGTARPGALKAAVPEARLGPPPGSLGLASPAGTRAFQETPPRVRGLRPAQAAPAEVGGRRCSVLPILHRARREFRVLVGRGPPPPATALYSQPSGTAAHLAVTGTERTGGRSQIRTGLPSVAPGKRGTADENP